MKTSASRVWNSRGLRFSQPVIKETVIKKSASILPLPVLRLWRCSSSLSLSIPCIYLAVFLSSCHLALFQYPVICLSAVILLDSPYSICCHLSLFGFCTCHLLGFCTWRMSQFPSFLLPAHMSGKKDIYLNEGRRAERREVLEYNVRRQSPKKPSAVFEELNEGKYYRG